jgi:hypothetical protein
VVEGASGRRLRDVADRGVEEGAVKKGSIAVYNGETFRVRDMIPAVGGGVNASLENLDRRHFASVDVSHCQEVELSEEKVAERIAIREAHHNQKASLLRVHKKALARAESKEVVNVERVAAIKEEIAKLEKPTLPKPVASTEEVADE